MITKRLLYCLFLISHLSFSFASSKAQQPWTFWYWMYGAVSEAGVKADLQAMKDVGLGGCYLMPIRGAQEHPEYGGKADALSENFWRMVDYAMLQADSLGLEMGIHVCDGFALAGGPWITPAESMQRVVFCDTVVGGGHHELMMRKPQHNEGYYEDIGVYAIPLSTTPDPSFLRRGERMDDSFPRRGEHNTPLLGKEGQGVVDTSGAKESQHNTPLLGKEGQGVVDTHVSYSPEVTVNDKGVYCADQPCWLQCRFNEPTLVRSIEIEPSGTNIQCQRLTVKASDDGVSYYQVKQLTPPRQGWQNTGFTTTFTIPPTIAKYFRFEWTPEGTEPGAEDLDAAKWKPVFRLKRITLSDYALIDNWEGKAGYVWRIAPDTPEADLGIDDFLRPQDIVMTKMQDSHLTIDLPEGRWRILRMGHTSTGHTNATAGGAKGLECDKFSRQAVAKQIDNWFGLFMQRPHHQVVKYMHVDSWECGSQNWSRNFAREFQRRRGYDILPLLPLYAGVPMSGGEGVLRDVRRTINELVNEVFFAIVAQKARQYGVQLSSESVAPTMVSDGMEHYKFVDVPMGEYWLNSPTHDKPNDMLDAISAAHVYGKQIVQAEGFTEVRGVWNETPAMVKPLLDRNFCLGMNRLFFHVNTHNPWLDRKPGMTLDGIGLFFQRDQTWFPEAKAFVDYITRCQTLLQKGKPVVDIAVYTGEEIPCRAFTPDRLVPMLPGLFGPERIASERERLANVGQPMEESPVGVRHSAGILDLKDWVNPLHGYQYDSMNKDALLTQPFNYKVLVVPSWGTVSAEVSQRISYLRSRGVTVVDKPYTGATFQKIVPDAVLPEGIAYAHRTGEGFDIYFLSNQTAREQTFTPVFRQKHETAVVYHPLTGEQTTFDGSITLPPYGSLFVCYGQVDGMSVATANPVTGKPLIRTKCPDSGSYDIAFRESGMTLKDQTLFDWSQHSDDRIRYFSGHARYTTTWKLAADEVPQGRTWLSLPSVKDMAHVWINGKDCGIAWTAPYEVEITGALKKGRNTVEIEVVNTWHNALRGMDLDKAPYPCIWTNAKYRTKGEALLPAGLLEAPEIITEQ